MITLEIAIERIKHLEEQRAMLLETLDDIAHNGWEGRSEVWDRIEKEVESEAI